MQKALDPEAALLFCPQIMSPEREEIFGRVDLDCRAAVRLNRNFFDPYFLNTLRRGSNSCQRYRYSLIDHNAFVENAIKRLDQIIPLNRNCGRFHPA